MSSWTSPRRGPAPLLQRGLGAGVLLTAALIFFGLVRHPTALTASAAGVTGVAGDLVILLVYGGAARFGIPWLAAASRYGLRVGLVAGLLAGAVFAAEILLEYVLLPADNTLMGTLEFGIVFSLFFACSVLVAFKTKNVANGALAAVLAALIASLIWYSVLLAVFYAFAGTARQAQVLAAEGSLVDFARSGMSDFSAWLMQDYLGAGFFHLLLAPLLAGVLGLLGAAFGRGLLALRAHVTVAK